MIKHVILITSFFSLKGQLATSGLDVRSIPSNGDCSDFTSDTRDATMAARSKSIRGSAGDHEKIPRHTKGPIGPCGSIVRAEAATTREESESTATPDKEKFPGAISHNDHLLLLSTILRNLRCHI